MYFVLFHSFTGKTFLIFTHLWNFCLAKIFNFCHPRKYFPAKSYLSNSKVFLLNGCWVSVLSDVSKKNQQPLISSLRAGNDTLATHIHNRCICVNQIEKSSDLNKNTLLPFKCVKNHHLTDDNMMTNDYLIFATKVAEIKKSLVVTHVIRYTDS